MDQYILQDLYIRKVALTPADSYVVVNLLMMVAQEPYNSLWLMFPYTHCCPGLAQFLDLISSVIQFK